MNRLPLKGFVFGGFTKKAWTSSKGRFVKDEEAFVFSLINHKNKPVKLECKQPNRSILSHKNYGPSFGWCDIRVADNSNLNYNNYSELHTYKFKEKMEPDDDTLLAADTYFKIFEIEVFESISINNE